MKKSTQLLLSLAIVGFSNPAIAQDGGASKHLTLLGIQSATTAPNRLAFASLSGTTRRSPTASDADGSAAFGIGFGDANAGLGFQVTGHVTSLTNALGDSGYFALKASTRISDGPTPIYAGVSVENLLSWGDSKTADIRGDVMLTAFPTLTLGNGKTYPLMLTLGVGSDLRNNATDPGIFAGAGIGLTSTTGLSAAWTGEDVALGVSFRPRELRNMTVSAVLEDAFNQEDNRRVTISLNWAFRNAIGG